MKLHPLEAAPYGSTDPIVHLAPEWGRAMPR